MQLAVEHLVSRGHSRIGYLCDSKHDSEESVTRFRCLQELGKERKLSIRKVELGERRFGLEQYFSYVKPETALIAHSDEYAVEAVQIAQRRGVRIPHDFSIIGFDSTPFCEYQSPPLTSISQPLEQMGSIAVDRLVERIEGLPCSSIETVVPCGLDVRGSTGYV
jgi:DNA-binding LacI/PurR family transcriptional regulator